MRDSCRVIVVGAGPAGLAAAERLAGEGIRALVLDEGPVPGGKFLALPPGADAVSRRCLHPLRRLGESLLERLREAGTEIACGSQVLGMFGGPPHRVVIDSGRGKIREVEGDLVILATGARERFLPFRGWELPGVMATGAIQLLLKQSAMIPTGPILVGGSGPLPLAVAAQIAAAGSVVSAVFDLGAPKRSLGLLRYVPRQPVQALKAAWYVISLLARGIPLRHRVRILEARGRRGLETVVSARVDGRGNPLPGTEREERADVLAVGFGLVPNIELAAQAGCRLVHEPALGGWIVAVDDEMQTSVPAVYAVGESSGIGGAEKAFVEGRMAAEAVLHRLERIPERVYLSRRKALAGKRRRTLEYARWINGLSQVPEPYYAGLADETLVCRCEGVTLGAVRKEIQRGATSVNAVKRATRSTMGDCQGRLCAPIIMDLLATFAGPGAFPGASPSVRFPVKPVTLEALAAAERTGAFTKRSGTGCRGQEG